MESPVHSEKCTPGSVRGARKPVGESRQGVAPHSIRLSLSQGAERARRGMVRAGESSDVGAQLSIVNAKSLHFGTT
jgi:hypothetical protein